MIILHPKGPKTWSAPGGVAIHYDDNDDDDNNDDYDDDDVFSKTFFLGL